MAITCISLEFKKTTTPEKLFICVLSELQHHLTFIHFFFHLQQENMEKVDINFKPSFPDICDFFCLIIDHMIISVKELPRIEHLLFQSVEDLQISTIRSVIIEEELVDKAKDRIRTVVMGNSHGPNL